MPSTLRCALAGKESGRYRSIKISLGKNDGALIIQCERTLRTSIERDVGISEILSPMRQAEGLRIRFKPTLPFIVKITIDSRNAISGLPEGKSSQSFLRFINSSRDNDKLQDYLVVLSQEALDGARLTARLSDTAYSMMPRNSALRHDESLESSSNTNESAFYQFVAPRPDTSSHIKLEIIPIKTSKPTMFVKLGIEGRDKQASMESLQLGKWTNIGSLKAVLNRHKATMIEEKNIRLVLYGPLFEKMPEEPDHKQLDQLYMGENFFFEVRDRQADKLQGHIIEELQSSAAQSEPRMAAKGARGMYSKYDHDAGFLADAPEAIKRIVRETKMPPKALNVYHRDDTVNSSMNCAAGLGMNNEHHKRMHRDPFGSARGLARGGRRVVLQEASHSSYSGYESTSQRSQKTIADLLWTDSCKIAGSSLLTSRPITEDMMEDRESAMETPIRRNEKTFGQRPSLMGAFETSPPDYLQDLRSSLRLDTPPLIPSTPHSSTTNNNTRGKYLSTSASIIHRGCGSSSESAGILGATQNDPPRDRSVCEAPHQPKKRNLITNTPNFAGIATDGIRAPNDNIPISQSFPHLAYGVAITQEVVSDSYDPSLWDRSNSIVVNIRVLTEDAFRTITEMPPPDRVIGKEVYAKYGMEFDDDWIEVESAKDEEGDEEFVLECEGGE